MEFYKASLCVHRCSLYFARILECPRMTLKTLLDSITGQNMGPGWGIDQQMVSNDLLLHLFPNFSPLLKGPKINRLNKIHISTRKSFLSEVNFRPRWINTLENLLLDTMAESSVWFTIITHNFSSSPRPQMVVTFLMVPLHWQETFQNRGRKRG